MPRQAFYWILTLSAAVHPAQPALVPGVQWIKGQKESGSGGFEHWQFVVGLSAKGSVRTLQGMFPGCHAEATRSKAAEEYVWKEDTRIDGTQFECGEKPLQRNSAKDWDKIWESAICGRILDIPADVRIRSYHTIKTIASDFAKPVGLEKTVLVYHGPTGTGKSRRAWDEAGLDAYPKDPRTKFFCGYQGQKHIIFDEFRGGIDVAHILRWTDRYPCMVELKGASTCLLAEKIWFTSNLPPELWYPELDLATRDALLRRLVVEEIN